MIMITKLLPTAALPSTSLIPVSTRRSQRANRSHRRATGAPLSVSVRTADAALSLPAGSSSVRDASSSSLALSLTTGCCAATPTPYAQQPLSSKSTLIVESRLSDGGGCHAVRTSGLHSRGACASFPTGCVTPAAGQCWLSTYGLSACVSRTLHGRRGASTDRKVNSHSH
jgi:hypothetical protein